MIFGLIQIIAVPNDKWLDALVQLNRNNITHVNYFKIFKYDDNLAVEITEKYAN